MCQFIGKNVGLVHICYLRILSKRLRINQMGIFKNVSLKEYANAVSNPVRWLAVIRASQLAKMNELKLN